VTLPARLPLAAALALSLAATSAAAQDAPADRIVFDFGLTQLAIERSMVRSVNKIRDGRLKTITQYKLDGPHDGVWVEIPPSLIEPGPECHPGQISLSPRRLHWYEILQGYKLPHRRTEPTGMPDIERFVFDGPPEPHPPWDWAMYVMRAPEKRDAYGDGQLFDCKPFEAFSVLTCVFAAEALPGVTVIYRQSDPTCPLAQMPRAAASINAFLRARALPATYRTTQ
jgi:hypothetical protein